MFGLASVALPTAMIEHAVGALGIDRVIPMAAAPLGTTTRILIALTMTILGGLIGALAGRRLARSKPEVPERRRSMTPVAAENETAREPEKSAQRRRPLACEPGEEAQDDGERALVPGHDTRILNIAEFDLNGYEEPAEPMHALSIAVASTSATPADVEAVDAAVNGHPQESESIDAAAITVEDDSHTPDSEPMAEESHAPFAAECESPSDAGDDTLVESALETPAPREYPHASEGLSNSLFENFSRGIGDRKEAQAPTGDGEGAPPFAAPSATPADVAGLPRLGGDNENEPQRETNGETAVAAFVPAEQARSEAASPDGAEISVETTSEADDDDAPCLHASGKNTAAERIASAELDELSPVELLERLGLAMAQRREHARLAAAAPAPAPILAEVVENAVIDEPEPVLEAEENTFEPETAEPLPFAAPRIDPAPETASDPQPLEAETAQDDVEQTEPLTEPVMPRIPAALRPVDLGDFAEDEDHDSLPGYIPPRHIGLAPSGKGEEKPAFAAPENAFSHDDGFEDDEESEDEESRVLEEGYSSLLDLSRPLGGREKAPQQFVRIDEPEDEGDIQPVVIFPGDDPREAPFAVPFQKAAESPPPAQDQPAAGQPEVQQQRPFDAPDKTDPEETEKALRAALATLQRMSGAA
ncbi:hypothetical protein LK12_05085 [Novosphingobium malaysiense]|uniref:Uncharacterized protein n=1 Tax=Novosphingobium malaysiense TaxID=1348853 RepID=A0A0B1ZM90_9SPHN|nr:hypothetical protein LK12_05085 [Novosphingobium malaysiense]